MKTILLAALFMTASLTAQSYYRHAPLGALAGTCGTIIGTTLGGGDKAAGIAGGALFSIASSLLVRDRTDAITSLHTTAAGFAATAALTISLNHKKDRRKKAIKCSKIFK